MGIKDFLLSVTPGQGPAAAAVAREQAAERKRKQQARAERASKERARRHKRDLPPLR